MNVRQDSRIGVKTPQTLAILKGLPKKKDAKYRVSTKGLKPSGLFASGLTTDH
jgi:hypothetical protein